MPPLSCCTDKWDSNYTRARHSPRHKENAQTMLILFTPVALPGPNSALEIRQEARRLLIVFPSTEGFALGLYTKMDSMEMEVEGPGSLVCWRDRRC